MTTERNKRGMPHRRREGWPGAVLAVALGWGLLIFPVGSGLRDLSYDLGFWVRPKADVDSLVIVYMDEGSHTRLGQGRWERWDRSLHARLLDRLRRAGAKVVAFDVLFHVATEPLADQALMAAAAAHGRVVMAAKMTPQVHDGEIIGWQLTTPLPGLTNAAAWGVVEVGGEDTAVRSHFRSGDEWAPTLAWRAAEMAGVTTLAGPQRERWVNYYGPPGHVPWISYADVLEGSDEDLAKTFSDRLVFVGAIWDVGFTGGKGTDDFRTPFTRWGGGKSPGVEVNATVCLNLLRGDWLRRAGPVTELLLVLALGCGFGFGLGTARVGWAVVAGVVGAAGVAGFCVWLPWWSGIWFPWLIVVAVQLPASLGCFVLLQTRRLAREKKLLQQRLAWAGKEASVVEDSQGSPVRSEVEAKLASAAHGEAPREVETVAEQPPAVADHKLLRKIGEGAYGEVWLGRDLVGRFHAVKVVYRRTFRVEAPYAREFRGISRFAPISLSHPGFVPILQVGRNESPEYLYYVMELGDDVVSGQQIDPETYAPRTLAADIARRKRVPLEECLVLSEQLADALEFLHQHRLIHRDIKPSNLIFHKGLVKFADVGLVKEVATLASTSAGTYVGTQGYIPPEGPGTATSDVYSLGKVIYEAAFGLGHERFPELPTALLEDEDERMMELNQIVLRACEHDPKQRYASAAELRDALKRARNGAGGNQRKPSATI